MKRSFLPAAATIAYLLLPSAWSRAQDAVAPNIGHHLPPLQFQDLAGMSHRLDWSGTDPKAYIVMFFEPRCADCFRELVFLDSLCRLARGLNLEVFAVEGSGQEPPEVEATMSRFVSMFQQPSFAVVPDPSYGLSSFFNVQRVPSTFLVERNGVVMGRKEGFDNFHAIDLARKAERLLGVTKGRFTPALAYLGVSDQEEKEFERVLEQRRRAEDSGDRFSVPLAAGATVPPFEFIGIDGARGRWSPPGREGAVTVVFFWGALCQPCIGEMDYLEKLRSAAGGSDLEIIAIEATGRTPERTAQVMERYRKFHPLPSYTVAADPDRQLSRHFAVGGALPQTFVIDAEGAVLFHADEFAQGGEWVLAGEIERALGLKAGTLSRGVSAYGPSSSEESPTIIKGLSPGRSEEFVSSLIQAETLFRNWQYSAAIPHYLRCLEMDPGNVVVRERLGEIYQRQGELERSLEQWRKILEIEPEHPEALQRVEKLGKSPGRNSTVTGTEGPSP